MEEVVVLVDENNNPLDTMPKSKVHGLDTPLHRAFSIFIFNDKKQLLLQQRSHLKLTWPLVWSNSCCGHPLPNESNENAIRRRVSAELGAEVIGIRFISPYRYRFTRGNITENEICPIFVGIIASDINSNSDEVEEIKWIGWQSWLEEIKQYPENFSEWCVEESLILAASHQFKDFIDSI